MTELTLEFSPEARRYPGRYEVVDAMLIADGARIPVVVKKTPSSFLDRFRGTRAERSVRVAKALLARGLSTPEPLGAEVRDEEAWFVARRLEGSLQVREWFLHRDDPDRFPRPSLAIPFDDVVLELGRVSRRLHDGGVFYRDLSDGNVLVTSEDGRPRLWLVDLSRARVANRPVSLMARFRDLARPGLNAARDRNLLLQSYFAPGPVPWWAPSLLSGLRLRRVLWDDLKRTLRPWRR